MLSITRLLLPLLLLFIALLSNGQIVDCNGFIKGDYLEAGVNWNGAFGSSTAPPAGYHPERTSTLYRSRECSSARVTDSAIGFVADVDRDGWYSGSPTRLGDYLLPDVLQEGWSYETGGEQLDCWNIHAARADTLLQGASSYQLGYHDSAGVVTLRTQTTVAGMYITHFYTLKRNDLFIKVDVLLENTNLFPINNVFYQRTVSPRCDQSTSGVGANKYKIERTLPDTLNRTIVSARGLSNPKAYLALATQELSALGYICRLADTPTTDVETINSGGVSGYSYNQGDSISGTDMSMGITINVGNFVAGGYGQITYLYAFSPTVFDSTLNTVNSIAGVTRNEVQLYPNPCTNQLNIFGLAQGDVVELWDMAGRVVANGLWPLSHGKFSTDDLAPGMYVVVVKDRLRALKARLIVQRL
jgi:hypothetical protein